MKKYTIINKFSITEIDDICKSSNLSFHRLANGYPIFKNQVGKPYQFQPIKKMHSGELRPAESIISLVNFILSEINISPWGWRIVKGHLQLLIHTTNAYEFELIATEYNVRFFKSDSPILNCLSKYILF